LKALVTGGCGFIGSHLVDRLVAEGHAVSVLDNLSSGKPENLNAKATLTHGDVADGDVVARLVGEAEVVFHLAAIASVPVCEQQPELAARTNVTGTELIFNAAAARKIPVIYASSAAVYGDNPELPLSEISATGPLGNYGRHKLQNEAIAAANKHAPSIGLRFFNVYGPRQDASSPYSGVISKFMRNAVAGRPLTFFGDGGQTRDFIYVADIVDLLMASWKHAHGCEVFNGCTGKQVSLKELAATILSVTGSSSETRHEEGRAGDIRHSLGSTLKASNLLGFSAKTRLESGLNDLYRSEVAHAA
jgi:UDP-glucose 4-epimerase